MEQAPPAATIGAVSHINQYQLSKRWNISARTLEHWRWERTGPTYIKLGRRVVYSIADIEAFERKQRQDAPQPPMPVYQIKQARQR